MGSIPRQEKRLVKWSTPPRGTLKFNVDGDSKGKSGPTRIGGVLTDHLGCISIIFTEAVETKESNETELLSIRRALTLGSSLGGTKLEIENDSSNAIKWTKGIKRPPWRLITFVREIKGLFVGLEVSFLHIKQSANDMADFLLKMVWKDRSGEFSIYREDSCFCLEFFFFGSFCLCLGLSLLGPFFLFWVCFIFVLLYLVLVFNESSSLPLKRKMSVDLVWLDVLYTCI